MAERAALRDVASPSWPAALDQVSDHEWLQLTTCSTSVTLVVLVQVQTGKQIKGSGFLWWTGLLVQQWRVNTLTTVTILFLA